MRRDTSQLSAYLAALGRADLQKMDRSEQIALYVNAYNAFTVKLITEYYPDIESIRDIPDGIFSRKRWKHKRWRIGGRMYSLSEIEHDVLRSKFKEPRVHYALNCASISCPPLWGEPYEGEKLDEQLDAAAKAFQINPKGFRLDRAQRVVYLSRIHHWYRKDFEEAAGSVARYVAKYAPRETAEFLLANEKDLKINYMDYDWRLNDVKNRPPAAERRVEGEPHEEVRELAVDCCREGAELTATLWYSAWVKSANVQLPDWHERTPVAAGMGDADSVVLSGQQE